MSRKLKSVLVGDLSRCIICGSEKVQIHHCLYGRGVRKLADQDGYIVPLCWAHHLGDQGVHFNSRLDADLKKKCQEHFEETHTREEFIRRYGKSYLGK